MTKPIKMFLDGPARESRLSVSRPLTVRGWAFSSVTKIDRVEVSAGDRLLGKISRRLKRPDVAAAFPGVAPVACGFDQCMVLDNLVPGDTELTVTAFDKAGNTASFRQPITLVAVPKKSERAGARVLHSLNTKIHRRFETGLNQIRGRLRSRPLSVEIRIPISATEKYLRILHYFLESLQAFGGPLAGSAHCVVSVSRDEPWRDLVDENPWINNYSVEFEWMEPDLFDRWRYDGTGMHRLNLPSKADVVMLLDADLLVAGDLDPVIRDAYRSNRILGFLAHVSPFSTLRTGREIPSDRWWEWVFEEAGLPGPDLKATPSAWDSLCRDGRHRFCPDNYFNCGVMIGPRTLIEQLGKTYETELEAIERVLDTTFRSQIANVMACERHRIPCGTVPLNYNFALNVPEKELRERNPDPEGMNRPEDIRIFHYLARGEVNKQHFETRGGVEELLQRDDLSPSGTEMQRKLQIIHSRISARLSVPA